MAKLIDLIVSGKSSFASDINAKTIYSTRLYMSGAISTCNAAGSWVSGMTNAAIMYNNNTAISASSYYHPFLSMKAAGGHVVNFGGLNNTIGFYGFYNGRTANDYDWYFTVNSSTGNWSMSKSITASAFITSGGNSTQVVRGDGILASISSLSVSSANSLNNLGMLDTQEKIDNFLTANKFQYAIFKTAAANNLDFSSNDGMILSIPWNNTSYGAQLAFDDVKTAVVKVRAKSGNWGSWYTLLHSGNYNAYAPTKTGGGASGTWGINITGNAAYANTANTATSIGSGALKHMCSLHATNRFDAYKIITNWDKSWTIMPTINIRGYAYGNEETIDCDIVIYHYNNTACSYSLTNKGSYAIRVWQAIENDVQVFYINPGTYYGMFNVFVYSGLSTEKLSGWSMVTASEVSGTEITKKAIATNITGNAATATNAANAANADTVDGQHFNWSNDKNDHTYLWATSTNGRSYLVHRASMSVNYANSAESAKNADRVDNQHAGRFAWIYNSGEYLTSTTVTCDDMAADNNSNAHMGMINAKTNNPTGSSKWVHVWSQTWVRGVISSWVSQIALGVSDGTGMWYRTTAGNLTAKGWTRVIDSENIGSQSVNYASSAGNADTLDGYHAAGLFTNLSNSGNNISITVGGTNKTLTVGYATSAGNADTVDNKHASYFIYSSIGDWINKAGHTYTVVVNGDSNTYYPVRITSTEDKTSRNQISVWKNLGSPTASYPGNHSNGTSSLWLQYEGRNTGWDGNGGYFRTWYKYQIYATLISHAEGVSGDAGDLVVWLRGGGTEYKVSTTYNSGVNVYLQSTNIGSTTYPKVVEPRTDIGNAGIIDSIFYGNASSADKWKTARTFTIGSTAKSVDGSGNASWSLAELGAAASTHTHKVKINGAEKTITASGGNAVDLGSYLPLSGGTMTGVATFTSGSSNAFDKTAISFIKTGTTTEQARIGTDSINNLGLYATGGIYIRPNVALGSGNTNGLVISSSTFTYNLNTILHSGNYNSYAPTLKGAGASGTWGISISGNAATATNANNADTVDGIHGTELVPKCHDAYFYPYITKSNGKQWYKITLAHNGHYRENTSWYMLTMQINLGGSYTGGSNGRIFLSYYFSKAANQNGAYHVNDVRGIGIGCKLSDNGVTIKYDLANPAIFYIKANNNNYNSISIDTLTANDTASIFDYRNTTIEAVASCPESCNQTVPLIFVETKDGSDLYCNNNTILTSANYNSYAPTKTGGGASGTWGISITGNAATASKLGTSTVGGATTPIYLNAGVPTVCTSYANASVNYANTSGAISNLTTSDDASSSSNWRKVWMSYLNGTTGRPSLSSDLVFQTSTGTLKAPIFQGNLSGKSTSAGTSDYAYYLRGRATNGTYYDTSSVNNIIAEWNTKSDNRWYLKAASTYECRVDYATSAGNADTVDGEHLSAWTYPKSPRDFTKGTIISTNINYATASGQAFYMEIVGDTYGSTGSMLTLVQGYIYNNTIINYSVNNLGRTKIDHLYAINVNGLLTFWFERLGYWQSYRIGVYQSSSGNYWKNQCTSITDGEKPSGTKEIDLCAVKYTNAYTDSTVAAVSHSISFKNSSNSTVSFNGSSDVDLTGGVYHAVTSDNSGNATTATIARSLGTDNSIKLYVQNGNEVNFGGTNGSSSIFFGYKTVDSKPIPTEIIFGSSTGTSNLKASKFIKTGSSDSYVLLGAGGHKLLSDFATSGHTHSYLPLSGGTMTGQIQKAGASSSWIYGRTSAFLRTTSINGYSPFASIKTSNGSWEIGAYHQSSYYDDLIFTYCTDENFNSNNNASTAQIRFLEDGKIAASITGNAATATNADLLDNKHAIELYWNSTKYSADDLNTYTQSGTYGTADNNPNKPNVPGGTVYHHTYSNNAYKTQIFGSLSGNRWFARTYLSTWKNWREFAFLDSNVASATTATKLQTARTLWGQSFDGTANVSGNMSNVGSISMTGLLFNNRYGNLSTDNKGGAYIVLNKGGNYIGLGASNQNNSYISLGDSDGQGTWKNEFLTITPSGNVGISNTSPSYKLHVNGTLGVSDATTLASSLTVSGQIYLRGLQEGTSTVTDNTEILTSYASNNGFADTASVGTVYRRDAIHLYNYVKGKLDSVYSPLSHTHSYLPLSGGTLTGGLGKSNNYVFKPNGADYRTKDNTHTGAICISLPANIGNTMVSMWIDVYNYVTNKSFSVHVGGYTYSNQSFISTFAMVYGASHKVRLTYSNGFKIYIGETTSTWSHPQISVRDVLLGYNPTYASWLTGWSISFVTSFPTINNEISRYVLSSDNYSSLSPNTHTHSISINGVTKTIPATGGNAVDLGSYLPLTGGTMTGSPYICFPASVNNTNLIDSTPTGLTYGRLQSYGTMTICGDTNGSTTEYVNITAGYSVANATAANGLSIGYNTLKWKGNTIWHAGNLTPKTITLSTSAQTYVTASGTNYTLKLPNSDPYTSARTPTAHTHYATTYKDSRNEAMTPAQGAAVNGVAIDFKTKANGVGAGSGSYCGLVTFDPYSDVSGGYPIQMGFNTGTDANNTNEVYIRTVKDSTTWNTWRTIINDANYTSYTVKKDGTGASGTWGISITGNATSATQATNLTPENTAHYFRDPNNSTWRGGMIWGSGGSESMSFVAANNGTRFQFVGGSDISTWGSSTWQSANPYLTIYSSGIVTPGSATASGGFIKSGYDNTYVLLAGGGHKAVSDFTPASHNHDTVYVKKAGDTMTGLLTTTFNSHHKGIKVGDTYINAIGGNLIFQNNSSIRFGGDSWDYNVWAGLKYVHSSKIIYLGLADGAAFTANNNQSGGKLYLPGIDNVYTGNGTNLVWHAGNDGSGSGLDADMTDGLHVHGGRNNEANKIVRTDGSGYIQANYINTNVGTEDTLSCSRLFFEHNNDGYIRKLSPSRFRELITDPVYLPRLRMRNPSNDTTEHGVIPFLIALKGAGYPVYDDPEFSSGTNNVDVYNNSSGGAVTRTRIADNQGSANSSGYILQISTTSGEASPGRGGFYQGISSRKNAVFAQVFRAKIPTGFSVVNAENPMGSGYKTYWLTDTAGTGKWEWYVRVTICGNGGTFSRGGHVYLNGSGAVTWYLSYCNVIDLSKGKYDGLRTRYSDTSDAWSTARSFTIGSATKQVDGSGNVSWTLAELGASAAGHTHKVKINGVEKTITASGGNAVDLGSYLKSSDFTTFSGGGISSNGNTLTQNNHSITIGGVTKTAGSSTASIINSLSISKLVSSPSTNLTAAITINGQVSADKTLSFLWATALTNTYVSDPAKAVNDTNKLALQWFSNIASTTPGSAGYAGNNYGFPVRHNANGILYLGTHDNSITNHYFGGQLGVSSDGHLYYRYNNGNAWSTAANGGSWNTILDSNNYSSYALPLSGGTMSGTLNTRNSSGTFISGMTEAAIRFNNLNAIDTGSFWKFFNMKSHDGHVVCYGGIYNNIGFYGYYSGRTENGTDWSFVANTTNGNWTATASIYAASFYENSDVRLKKDIKSIASCVNIPIIKEFKWKQTDHKSYGLIAQDLEAMGYPELVDIKDDGYKSVNYTAAHSLIIGKLQLKIKELEDNITNLLSIQRVLMKKLGINEI